MSRAGLASSWSAVRPADNRKLAKAELTGTRIVSADTGVSSTLLKPPAACCKQGGAHGDLVRDADAEEAMKL